MRRKGNGLAKEPNIVDVEVGARIRLRRRVLGMTQVKLANSVGVTFQQIQKYERGTNRVGASRLLQIANVLGVPASFFFQIEKEPFGTSAHPHEDLVAFILSDEGLALNFAFAKVRNAKVRARIVALVKAIGDEIRLTSADAI